MKRNHYLILGGIVLIGGYMLYKRREKSEMARKAVAMDKTPLKSGEVSNIGGTCTCGNGFTGYCAGDCRKCCTGMDTPKRPTETRTFKFMKQEKRPNLAYGSQY